MAFLRRLLGGSRPANPAAQHHGGVGEGSEPSTIMDDERDLIVLRDEAARLDELQQRQLRYSEYAWTPEAQGGLRRADDEDAAEPG